MRPPVQSRFWVALFLYSAWLNACEQAPRLAHIDTPLVAVQPSVDSTVIPSTEPGWNSEIGTFLVVRGEPQNQAVIVSTQLTDGDSSRVDNSAISGMKVTLFGHDGVVGQARLGTVRQTKPREIECIEWPKTNITEVGTGALPVSWNVGLAGGSITGLSLDSLEALPQRDSASLAAELTRLASLLPDDTALAFRSVPFSVRTTYRFTHDGISTLLAEIARQVNQEANPLEERIFLIAKRRVEDLSKRYHTVLSWRTSGVEEDIGSTEVLAVVLIGLRPALIIERQEIEGVFYSLVGSDNHGRWRERWSSIRAGC